MIVCFFDDAYAPWGRVFLRSLARVHPSLPVVVGAVDLNEETQDSMRLYSNVEVVKLHVGETGSTRATEIANRRPYWFREIVRGYPSRWFLLTDADLIVRRPLDDLIAGIQASDAAIAFRDGFHAGRVWARLQVAAGLVGVSSSGVSLLDEWIGRMEDPTSIEEISRGEWFWEQTCLNLVARASMSRRTYWPIDERRFLSSPPFDGEAAIWSANVARDLKKSVYLEFECELRRLEGSR